MKQIKAEEKKEPEKIIPEIKMPSDVEFIRKLNERWKEEYRIFLIQRKRIEKIVGKGTLIIGARAKDGIVLASDRKVMRGQESEFEDKIRILQVEKIPIVFCAAGLVGVTDDFLELFQGSLEENITSGTVTSILRIKLLAEDLLKEFEERYSPRFFEPPMQFIFGGLNRLNAGEARLYNVGPPGYGERIKFYAVLGAGSPYAQTIVKYLFDTQTLAKLPIEKVAERAAACIFWIKDEIINVVGGEPQIVALRDEKPEILKPNIRKRGIEKIVRTLKSSLRSFVVR